MATPPVPDETLQIAAAAYLTHNRNNSAAARSIGADPETFRRHVKKASERGFFLDDKPPPAMPGFRVSQRTTLKDGKGNVTQESVQQKPEHGDAFELPAGHRIKGVSTLVNADGGKIVEWIKTTEDTAARDLAMRAALDAFKDDLPRAESVLAPGNTRADLVNQFTVTDYHFGMMAWGEETGGEDWDLKIAGKLWVDWFSEAVRRSPESHTAILAQLGDLLHFDGMKAITPAHGHILDADSRFSKIVREVIRCMRAAVRMLLEKHEHVHLIFSDANHDEASEIWLREMFAMHFEDEPRVSVDRSPGSYNCFEWGLTSLFYHHGHKKKFKSVDTTWVGRFRELFGRTKFSYGHTGHLHSDEMFTSNTGVKVERHETLASPSTYEANGGYTSGRSAKVITYSKRFGEVGRITLTPEMVRGST